MKASIPADYSAIRQRVAAGFVPLLKESPGFLFYATANIEPDMLAVVNVFTSEDEMLAANDLAADFVSEHLAPLLPTVTEIISGDVQLLLYANPCPNMGMDEDGDDMEEETDSETMSGTDATADMDSAYLGYRVYSEYEEEVNALIRDNFTPIINDTPGFILYLTMTNGDNGLVTLNIFQSQEEMIEANDHAATFVADDLSEFLTSPPTFYGGSIAVLDLSGLFPDENMSDEMGEESDEG